MWRSVARMQRMVPVRVMSSTLCHCSSVMSTSVGGAAEAGVVHDDVEPPVLGDGAVDHRLHLLLHGDVAHAA